MSECPRCTAPMTDEDYLCPRCEFQVIEPCPNCHECIPLEAYEEEDGILWVCPSCHIRLRARYAEPMTTDEGDLVEPLVRLRPATVAQPA